MNKKQVTAQLNRLKKRAAIANKERGRIDRELYQLAQSTCPFKAADEIITPKGIRYAVMGVSTRRATMTGNSYAFPCWALIARRIKSDGKLAAHQDTINGEEGMRLCKPTDPKTPRPPSRVRAALDEVLGKLSKKTVQELKEKHGIK